MKKLYTAFFLVVMPVLGMLNERGFDYYGTEITSETLPILMKKVSPLQGSDKQHVKKFMKNYGKVLKRLARSHPHTNWLQEIRSDKELFLQALNQLKPCKGINSGNFSFEVPNTTHCAIVAGPMQRVNNQLKDYGYEHLDVIATKFNKGLITKEEFDAILHKIPKDGVTYQGPSRAALYLKGREILKKNNITDVLLHRVHLVPFADSKSAPASDATTFIIEDRTLALQGGNPLTMQTAALTTIAAIKGLCIIAKESAGLWEDDLQGMVKVLDNGVVLIDDFQQANRESSQEFFKKNSDLNKVYIQRGFEALLNVTQHDVERHNVVKDFIRHDETLQTNEHMKSLFEKFNI